MHSPRIRSVTGARSRSRGTVGSGAGRWAGRLRTWSRWVGCGLAFAALSGCDFSTAGPAGGGTDGGQPPGGGTGPITAPILYRIETSTLCPGDKVTLVGINFPELEKNRVSFTAGTSEILGLPLLRVGASGGAETRLTVLIPGGLSPGRVRLFCDGIEAGGQSYSACPQIMGWALDRNGQGRYLDHQGPLGFVQPSYVELYGVGLDQEFEQVILEDATGLPASVTTKYKGLANVPGYVSIGINLHDDKTNVQLNPQQNRRDFVKVRVKTASGLSNTVQIPVLNAQNVNPQRSGAAINMVKVPTGVVTGSVRIYYNLYDIGDEVGDAYNVEVEWTADGGTTWYPAVYDASDPEGSGAVTATVGVLPGTMLHSSRYGLFRTGGAVRCFSWDAGNDPNFVQLNLSKPGQPAPPREWKLQFRLRPVPRGNVTQPFSFVTETPVVVYQYLEDRSVGDAIAAQRQKTFVETFVGNQYEDALATDASWGAPDNRDALISLGRRVPQKTPLFGNGADDVFLIVVPEEDLEPGIIDQYFEIDTDQTVIQHVFVDDAGTPDDQTDDLRIATPVPFSNPGSAAGEFHLSRLYVCPEFQRDAQGNIVVGLDGKPVVKKAAQVNVTGTKPLIFRLSGVTSPPDLEVVNALFTDLTVFGVGPGTVFDLNGRDGGTDGRPGAAGPGGGAGGAGGSLEVNANPGSGTVTVTAAAHGGNGELAGGEGGETTGAYDPSSTRSQFRGGGGGGGGHRIAGRHADSPKTAKFPPPRSGRGGPMRGDATQRYLTGGSGGGGGGAGLDFNNATTGMTATPHNGGGGGGGGGAFMAIANGEIVIDPTAFIQCNGGNGAAGGGATGAGGGGGSGGSIVLRAALSVDVDCGSLQVRGGKRGGGTATIPGDGAPGWIRLESAYGGTPNCAVFRAEATLSKDLSATEKSAVTVDSTAGFPDQGVLVVEGEEISYERIGSATTFELIGRTAPTSHASGAKVYLKGLVAPYSEPGVWTGGAVAPSPDVVAVGRARDAELHLSFEPGTDPETGELTRDPQTGEIIAIYEFDTDQGIITGPSGGVFLVVAASETDPGFLDLARLIVDRGVILRGVGSNPMRIVVSGEADIAGTIDVSGFPGGLLVFQTEDPERPLPGAGGRGGPGGADGGNGGTIVFRNGDVNDKSASNVVQVHGQPCARIPGAPAEFDRSPPPYGSGERYEDPGPMLSYTRALPGRSTAALGCGGPGEPPCVVTAGGGGGGGNLRPGSSGTSEASTLGGAGGSAFGLDSFRWGGRLWPFGAEGGGGGGACPHVSAEYLAGTIPGTAVFKGKARYAPGTGGGGGGGSLALVAEDLVLRATARILARGGNAYQSIDLGGNGGAGAGGYVLVQVKNTITVETGAQIDVSGGMANLPVPIEAGGKSPRYEGNIRTVDGRLTIAGGKGGDGAPGRIRIEADVGSMALASGNNSSVTSGPLLLETIPTQAVSKPIVLGVGSASVSRSHETTIESTQVRFFTFGQPTGTEAVILWEGARESLDQHGSPGQFLQRVRDPKQLRYREFVRFFVHFLSNRLTGEVQSIDEIRLDYRQPSAKE